MLQRFGVSLSLLISLHVFGSMAAAWPMSPIRCGDRATAQSPPQIRPPALEIQPAEFDFGLMAAGQSALASMSLVNGGSLQAAGCLHVSGDPFTIRKRNGPAGRRLPYVLAPGDTLLFDVGFTAPDGLAAGELLVFGAGHRLGRARLRGSGGIPRCSLDPHQIDFGAVAVGETAVRMLQVANNGAGVLLVSPRFDCLDDGFDLKEGFYLRPLELRRGGRENVSVCFRPRAVGRRNCLIRFNDLDCTSVHCSGVGVAADSTCFVVPSYLDFGSIEVGGARTMSFTILNLGHVGIRGIVRVQSQCYRIATGGGSYSLQPGQTRKVEVVFTPSEIAGHACEIHTGNSLCGPISCFGIGLDDAAWPAGVPLAEPLARLENGEVVLSWKCPVDSSDGFHVYRRQSDGPARRISSELVTGLAKRAVFRDRVRGLPVGSVVHYSYELVCRGQEVARSPEAAVTLSESTPAYTALHSNYPNPFNGNTTIEFELAEAARVRLVVCDLNGRRIRALIDAELPAASHVCQWDGRDACGRSVASGVYRYFLETGDVAVAGRMLLLR